MTRFLHVTSCAAALLAVATLAGAQTVNSLEVQLLVSRDDPAAHATLERHFATLASQYSAEAERHWAMARAAVGNPNRFTSTNPGAHCLSLAERHEASAITVRELARYHNQLAAGMTVAPPKDAARFQAGEGAPAPTPTQVRAIELSARTPSEHHFLEEYFTTVATAHREVAERHSAMAAGYTANPRGAVVAWLPCERVIKAAREAAVAALASATRQRQLANIG